MVVVDSSFLVAYHNERDTHHGAAERAMERLIAGDWGPAVLLEYVFLEVVTVVLARRGHGSAVRVGTALLEAAEIQFLPCSELFAETLNAFRAQPAGVLSFTDAAIVVVAERRQAPVLTFDQDFRTVRGLQILPQ